MAGGAKVVETTIVRFGPSRVVEFDSSMVKEKRGSTKLKLTSNLTLKVTCGTLRALGTLAGRYIPLMKSSNTCDFADMHRLRDQTQVFVFAPNLSTQQSVA